MTDAPSKFGELATIARAANRPLFTLINTFRAKSGQQGATVDSLARVTAQLSSLAGFVGASVHAGWMALW